MLTIVDLAGSERLSRSRSEAQRLEEAKAINKSISALGNCINALIYPKKHKHVPYRDSKLTRILTESLGGNSKTTLIACISPSAIQFDETLSTLLFANGATNISTFAIVNEEVKIQTRRKYTDEGLSASMLEDKQDLAKRNALLETENTNLKNTLKKLWSGNRTQCVDTSIGESSRAEKRRGKTRPKSVFGEDESQASDLSPAAGVGSKTMVEGDWAASSTMSAKERWNDRKVSETIKQMMNTVVDLQAELARKVQIACIPGE